MEYHKIQLKHAIIPQNQEAGTFKRDSQPLSTRRIELTSLGFLITDKKCLS